MRKTLVFLAVAALIAGSLSAQEEKNAPKVTFASVDVFVDSGDASLAAYQVELKAKMGDVKIVGIEGGEHAAFRKAPYYDRAAMSRDRVILAAFSTGKDLPKGKSRIARVMVCVTGDVKPEYNVELKTAATSGGNKITASVTIQHQGAAE